MYLPLFIQQPVGFRPNSSHLYWGATQQTLCKLGPTQKPTHQDRTQRDSFTYSGSETKAFCHVLVREDRLSEGRKYLICRLTQLATDVFHIGCWAGTLFTKKKTGWVLKHLTTATGCFKSQVKIYHWKLTKFSSVQSDTTVPLQKSRFSLTCLSVGSTDVRSSLHAFFSLLYLSKSP